MRRRAFLAFSLALSAVSRSQAQQISRPRRVAIVANAQSISNISETDHLYGVLLKELRRLGYVEGQSLIVQRYSAFGRTERLEKLAEEVVHAQPDLIFSVGVPLLRSLLAVTQTIPIVGILADPVGWGLVPSLARPGGNLTGVASDVGIDFFQKIPQLLKELVPTASRVGFLVPRTMEDGLYPRTLRAVAPQLGLTIVSAPLDSPLTEPEYRRAFVALAQNGVDSLILADWPTHLLYKNLVTELARAARLPTIYPWRDFVEVGGLIAYGTDLLELWDRAAVVMGLVLNGTKPADIPFYQPTRFKLTLNLKTANALGLTIPPTLLARADEVIE
jgi:putative tryptophan/tyrosine transport system substrate-binding protein